MADKRYFTVTTHDSGLADKVSWQLRTFYSLGAACGFHYIHTPLTFPRSWRSPTHSLTTAIYAIERKLLLDLRIRIPGYRIIHGALSKGISFLSDAVGDSGDKLNRFLGFDKITPRITDADFSSLQRVDIPVADILTNSDIKVLNDLQTAIDRCCPITSSRIYRFPVERITPSNIAKVKDLLVQSHADMDSGIFLGIRENYWSARQDRPVELAFDPEKIKVVIHYRLGDRAFLPMGDTGLYIHGSSITRELPEDIMKVDWMGRDTLLSDYENIMCRLFAKFGTDTFSCIFISDGYARTLEYLLPALGRRKLWLSQSELKVVREITKSGDQWLRDTAAKLNAYPIIGESNETLCKCIDAIASADVLVYGNPGFAYSVHRLFHKGGSSVTIAIEDDLDEACQRVGKMIPVSL
jgi:hypothetical protein